MNLVSKIKENPLLSLLIILLILLGIVFVVVMCFENPKRIFNLLGVSEKQQPKYEVLKFLGISMGGILIALQALMSYKRAQAMEETAKAQADAANAQADAAQAQARANENTEQGLRQERLKNAIEHLGNEKDSVRLGGAYELFHLAKDAKEDVKELRQTALDILCTHIRWTTSENEYQEKHESKPSEEIQSLLTLLFVQEQEVFKGLQINLQGSWLNGADLYGARLEKAILIGARLQKTNLEKANLQRGNLVRARLREANLSKACLQGATLTEARLQKTDLIRACLQRGNLVRAYLQDADLDSAYLQGTDLREAQLQEANLNSAHLQGAVFYKAHLQRAVLVQAHLQGAIFYQAHLQGAILADTHLQGAYLRGAQLHEADVAGARLQGANSRERPFIQKPFENLIRNQIGKETDLSRVVYAGGLTKEDVDSLIEGLPDEQANGLRWGLEPHIDQPISRELPEDSGAITGAYTKEEAEEWIAEYEEAMSELPEGDS